MYYSLKIDSGLYSKIFDDITCPKQVTISIIYKLLFLLYCNRNKPSDQYIINEYAR